MIFVTVGSSQYPFNRLIKAVDDLVEEGFIHEEVFFQIGTSQPPKHGVWERFFDFEKMFSCIKQSRLVISHAGVGTVLLCRMHGKMPIIMPRDKRLHEHVDNHQFEFIEKVKEKDFAIPVLSKQELQEVINNYPIATQPRSAQDSINENSSLAKYLVSCFQNKIK